MEKPDINQQMLMDELADLFGEPEIPEGAVTAKMLAREIHKSPTSCYQALEQLVAEGKLLKLQIRHCNYYFKPKKKLAGAK